LKSSNRFFLLSEFVVNESEVEKRERVFWIEFNRFFKRFFRGINRVAKQLSVAEISKSRGVFSVEFRSFLQFVNSAVESILREV